jgi:hypothetical protein
MDDELAALSAANEQYVTVKLYDLKVIKQFSRLSGELLIAAELADRALLDDAVLEAARDLRAFCDEHWMVEACH